MSGRLEITLTPERLDEGSPEERATFGLFVVAHDGASLTEGFDTFLDGYRRGPLVPGYPVAEWLAWNWWRLRWEPRTGATDWAFAHKMTAIGEGYVWPTLTIFSDGVRTALVAQSSVRADAKPFRYLGTLSAVVPSTAFEAAVDAFIPRMIGRLHDAGRRDSNLERLWNDVIAERRDPRMADWRRLEALLGKDADDPDEGVVQRLLDDSERLGAQAMSEVAANRAQSSEPARQPLSGDDFRQIAEAIGIETLPRDAARLRPKTFLPRGADVPAWRLGAAAAQALRDQERLGFEPISDQRLAGMAGTGIQVVEPSRGDAQLSFTLDEGRHSRIVLRSRWRTGRRFDLARLIGDRLIAASGALHPATRAYTYRQKAQRAFAAELLSPFEAVDSMMGGDYSLERQEEVAEHFQVSPMTINTLLVNHRRIDLQDGDLRLQDAA